jgi:large subunit ribosomal protein L4
MSVQLTTLTLDGQKTQPIEVSSDVFGVELNRHALYLALRQERINSMRGTANSKTRAEVSGGGRKPWKQKGTGRARAGSIRSPLWKGGGVTFGPKPRTISIKQNKKLVSLAHRCVLSNVVSKLSILDIETIKEVKTSVLAKALKASGIVKDAKVLIVYGGSEKDQQLKQMAGNIRNLKLSSCQFLSVQDMLTYKHIFFTKTALDAVQARLGGSN